MKLIHHKYGTLLVPTGMLYQGNPSATLFWLLQNELLRLMMDNTKLKTFAEVNISPTVKYTLLQVYQKYQRI